MSFEPLLEVPPALINILAWLEPTQFGGLASVCSKFLEMIRSPVFWHRVCEVSWPQIPQKGDILGDTFLVPVDPSTLGADPNSRNIDWKAYFSLRNCNDKFLEALPLDCYLAKVLGLSHIRDTNNFSWEDLKILIKPISDSKIAGKMAAEGSLMQVPLSKLFELCAGIVLTMLDLAKISPNPHAVFSLQRRFLDVMSEVTLIPTPALGDIGKSMWPRFSRFATDYITNCHKLGLTKAPSKLMQWMCHSLLAEAFNEIFPPQSIGILIDPIIHHMTMIEKGCWKDLKCNWSSVRSIQQLVFNERLYWGKHPKLSFIPKLLLGRARDLFKSPFWNHRFVGINLLQSFHIKEICLVAPEDLLEAIKINETILADPEPGVRVFALRSLARLILGYYDITRIIQVYDYPKLIQCIVSSLSSENILLIGSACACLNSLFFIDPNVGQFSDLIMSHIKKIMKTPQPGSQYPVVLPSIMLFVSTACDQFFDLETEVLPYVMQCLSWAADPNSDVEIAIFIVEAVERITTCFGMTNLENYSELTDRWFSVAVGFTKNFHASPPNRQRAILTMWGCLASTFPKILLPQLDLLMPILEHCFRISTEAVVYSAEQSQDVEADGDIILHQGQVYCVDRKKLKTKQGACRLAALLALSLKGEFGNYIEVISTILTPLTSVTNEVDMDISRSCLMLLPILLAAAKDRKTREPTADNKYKYSQLFLGYIKKLVGLIESRIATSLLGSCVTSLADCLEIHEEPLSDPLPADCLKVLIIMLLDIEHLETQLGPNERLALANLGNLNGNAICAFIAKNHPNELSNSLAGAGLLERALEVLKDTASPTPLAKAYANGIICQWYTHLMSKSETQNTWCLATFEPLFTTYLKEWTDHPDEHDPSQTHLAATCITGLLMFINSGGEAFVEKNFTHVLGLFFKAATRHDVDSRYVKSFAIGAIGKSLKNYPPTCLEPPALVTRYLIPWLQLLPNFVDPPEAYNAFGLVAQMVIDDWGSFFVKGDPVLIRPVVRETIRILDCIDQMGKIDIDGLVVEDTIKETTALVNKARKILTPKK